jgi:hypothetical protein
MHVLMPEITSTRARAAAGALSGAGHVVHVCHDTGSTGFACNALRGNPCPLEVAPIDVAVDVRPLASPTPLPTEDGVLCAARRHVPLVVAGEITANPFRPWTTVEHPGSEILEAVELAAASTLPELSARATKVLRRGLERSGTPVGDARVEVRREAGRLKITLVPDGPVERETIRRIAVRVHQEVRAADSFAFGSDVTIASDSMPREASR